MLELYQIQSSCVVKFYSSPSALTQTVHTVSMAGLLGLSVVKCLCQGIVNNMH